MLHAALTALLALQSASGSPNVAPQSPTSPTSSGGGTNVINAPSTNPGVPPSAEEAPAAQTPPPSAPTPVPTRTPTPSGRRGAPIPAAKASPEQLLVVNKTDDTVSILDGASGKVRA